MFLSIGYAAIFGAVQGLTEFLPISSSGHLLLLHELFDLHADALSFDTALHLGTLLALCIFFAKDIRNLIIAFFSSLSQRSLSTPALRLPWLLIIGAIPAAIVGFSFEGIIETQLRSPWVVVATLLIGALLFFVVERFSSQKKLITSLSVRDSLVVGCAQALALIPGLSRSGITIVAGMARGFSRFEAARFSFLLSIPVVFGAGLKKMLDLASKGITNDELLSIMVGIIVAAIFGIVAIKLLLSFTQRFSLAWFGYYRIVLACVVAILLLVTS